MVALVACLSILSFYLEGSFGFVPMVPLFGELRSLSRRRSKDEAALGRFRTRSRIEDSSGSWARRLTSPTAPTLNDYFPNLAGRTQNTDHFDLYEYLGNDWGIILMHPGDFTPVCTTELGKIAKLQHKFDERGVRLCGFSCNDSESHREWIRDIKQITGSEVKFPLFCDPYRRCASYLGILDETNRDDTGLPLTVRSVYILRPDKRVALIMTYPASTGRNVDEILRVFDSVKMTYDKAVATPVDWRKGDEVMINLPLSNADADLVFGKAGYRILDVPSERGKSLAKNYMRYTRDPSSGILSRIKRRIPGIRELSTSGALSLLFSFAAMVTLTQVSPAMGFRLLR